MKHLFAPVVFTLLLGACQGQDEGNIPGNLEDTQAFADIPEEEEVRFAGTEPFWSGGAVDGVLTWQTPDNNSGTQFAVERFAGRGGISFDGTLEGRSFDMTVTPGDCSDGMSDRIYPMVATVKWSDEVLNGCAWIGDERQFGDA